MSFHSRNAPYVWTLSYYWLLCNMENTLNMLSNVCYQTPWLSSSLHLTANVLWSKVFILKVNCCVFSSHLPSKDIFHHVSCQTALNVHARMLCWYMWSRFQSYFYIDCNGILVHMVNIWQVVCLTYFLSSSTVYWTMCLWIYTGVGGCVRVLEWTALICNLQDKYQLAMKWNLVGTIVMNCTCSQHIPDHLIQD